MITPDGWWIDFVAGWVSGATSVLACQPMDTVLTRYQAGQAMAAASGGELRLTSSVKGLAREFGIQSLWRGSSPMIGVVPFQNALLMGGYGIGKQYSSSSNNSSSSDVAADKTNGHDLFPIFVGGCAGGVLQSFLVSPVEWIKVHQQTGGVGSAAAAAAASKQQIAYSGSSTTNLARTLLQHKSNLWNRGLTATLLRDGIPHGVWFASYEYCKIELLKLNKGTSDESSSSSSSDGYYATVTIPLISGAFAATTAWAVGYPFDIIKTRIQATKDVSVQGVVETAKQLVVEADGNVMRGLYRGFGLKLARSIPASMIGFLTYEVVSSGLTK